METLFFPTIFSMADISSFLSLTGFLNETISSPVVRGSLKSDSSRSKVSNSSVKSLSLGCLYASGAPHLNIDL